MEIIKINTSEKLSIDSSNTTRYLGYPRKVPLWKLEFVLPEFCSLVRGEDNSDISFEIEHSNGVAFIPSLSNKEAEYRLKKMFPDLLVIKNCLRA